MFILYKTYSSPSLSSTWESGGPSYIEKLYTPGKIWVRLCDSPIAFPLEAVSENKQDDLAGIDGNAVYDFEIMPIGSKMCIVSEDSTTKLLKCSAVYIDYSLVGGCGIGHLTMSRSDPQSNSQTVSQDFPT